MNLTASDLFIKRFSPEGDFNCHYCGTLCNDKNKSKDYVKSTFTNRDLVQRPDSLYVCDGCLAMLNEKADIELVTGEKINNRNRLYSWVITKEKNIAYSKSHINQLREMILNPPEPPFVIVVATSGQKQLLFRSSIANSKYIYPILLEDENMIVNVEELQDALILARKVCALVGKKALNEDNTFGKACRFYELGNIDDLINWAKNKQKKMYRLAAYLCEPMDVCKKGNVC